MSNKIIVAKTGFNALSEADLNNIVFHSDYNTLKHYAQGIITVTTNRANYYDSTPAVPPIFPATYSYYTVETVAHGLSYIPHFAGYFHLSATTTCQCPWAFGDFIFFGYMAVYSDDTNLYFVVHFNSSLAPTGTVDADFSYRIFKNSLGL